VAAALQEAVDFYVSTGGNFPTPGDYMLTNHPFINIPKRTIKRHAESYYTPRRVVLVQLALNERNKERDETTNDGGIGGGQ
jgi:hypothetical protein